MHFDKMSNQKRIIVGLSGASGAILGVKLLETLKEADIEVHLVMSKSANITLKQETTYSVKGVEALADEVHSIQDIGAKVSSGSFKTSGMVILPCSVKTLAEIATGVTPNLLSRSADVILKERRKLVLCVRESPLHLGHIRNMEKVTEMGAIIAPPMPAFYPNPTSLEDIIDHTVGRVLDLFDIEHTLVKRWKGLK